MTGAGLLAVVVLLAAGVGVALLLPEIRRRRREQVLLQLLATFGPAVAVSYTDPERFVAWSEVARTARTLFPEAFARLDAASGERFPFSRQAVEAAHARWTADWLAWERQHDLEYKERTAADESALVEADKDAAERWGPPGRRNQEKLQTYQAATRATSRRKAIAALEDRPMAG